MGGRALTIRTEVPATELRRLARREKDRAAAARMQAIAGALEGMTRAEAARLAGMERQALRDAGLRYNAEGLARPYRRPTPRRRARLDEEQRSALRHLVLDGPEVEATGLSAWTLPELCREAEERRGVAYHPSHRGKLMRRLGLSRQKARPSHPKADAAAREAFAKGAAGRPRRRAGGASRQAPDAVVHGRGQVWPEGARLPPLVHPRPAAAGPLRPALHLDPPLRRRPAGDRRGLRPRAAAGLDRGDERLPRPVRRDAGRRRACRPGARPCRLAQGQQAGRPEIGRA